MVALLSGYEIWIVLAVALLLFGHRIPSMARSLGSGIVEFKKGLKGESDSEPSPRIDSGGSSGDPAASEETKSES